MDLEFKASLVSRAQPFPPLCAARLKVRFFTELYRDRTSLPLLCFCGVRSAARLVAYWLLPQVVFASVWLPVVKAKTMLVAMLTFSIVFLFGIISIVPRILAIQEYSGMSEAITTSGAVLSMIWGCWQLPNIRRSHDQARQGRLEGKTVPTLSSTTYVTLDNLFNLLKPRSSHL